MTPLPFPEQCPRCNTPWVSGKFTDTKNCSKCRSVIIPDVDSGGLPYWYMAIDLPTCRIWWDSKGISFINGIEVPLLPFDIDEETCRMYITFE